MIGGAARYILQILLRSLDKLKHASVSNSVIIVTLVDKLEANIPAFREEQDIELPGPAML